jgi:hypothetical protein
VSLGQRIGRGLLALLALGALALQGGVAWGATWVLDNERLLKDQLVAHQFDPSAEILRYVSEAGLSDTGALYLMTSLPRVVPSVEFDRYCSRSEPGIGVLGCYTLRDGRIYLYDVTDARLTSIEPVVAAHEMLHSAWARLSATEHNDIAVLLEESFATLPADHRLRERIVSYEDKDPASRVPELYAIIGTEIAPLPEALETHYRTYFSDRTKVVAHADEVYVVFDTLQQELLTLRDDLSSRNAEIDGLRYTYEEANSALRRDVPAFNEKAVIPGSFPSKSEFERVKDALLERQDRLSAMRTTLQNKIGEYNALVAEFTTLNDEVSELNQGINVTVEPKEQLQASVDMLTE